MMSETKSVGRKLLQYVYLHVCVTQLSSRPTIYLYNATWLLKVGVGCGTTHTTVVGAYIPFQK